MKDRDEEAPESSGGGLIDFLEDQDWTNTRWRLNRSKPGLPGELGSHLVSGTGDLDEDWIFERFGGGDYVISVKRPEEGWKKLLVSIEGPPIAKTHPGVAAAAAAAAPASASDPLVDAHRRLKALELEIQINSLQARIEAQRAPAAPPPPAIDPIDQFGKMVAIMRGLDPQRVDPAAMISSTLGIIDKVQSKVRQSEGGTSWADVARETLPQVIDFVSEHFPARGAAAGAEANGGKPAGSIEGAPPASVNRWLILVEMISGAFANDTTPEDLAISAECILQPKEIEQLRGASIDQIMTLLDRATDRFVGHPDDTPEQKAETMRAREYVLAFLQELRKPPAADEVTSKTDSAK